MPRERLQLPQGMGHPDRAHRLLGRPGAPLHHHGQQLHRERLVGDQADVGQGACLPGLPRHAPLPPLRHIAFSSHEVALGYKDDTEDPSVYIKFKLNIDSLKGSEAREQLANLLRSSGKPAYLLAWTTTPWTLPGNTALAVSPDAEYVRGRSRTTNTSSWRRARLQSVGLEDAPVVDEAKGQRPRRLACSHIRAALQSGTSSV